MREAARRILDRLGEAESRRIAVFGDYCLDKYLLIDSTRDELSRETGLTAYQVTDVRHSAGAAGTVVNNLRALGAQVMCAGLLGDDGEGLELERALTATGAQTMLMTRSSQYPTNVYIKPMRSQADGSYQELNRLDIRSVRPLSPALEEDLIKSLRASAEWAMGVIVVDQYETRNHSAVTDRIRAELALLASRYPEKPIYVDSRRFAAAFRGIIVKCNEKELVQAIDPQADPEDLDAILRCGRALRERTGRAVVTTLGNRGAYVFESACETHIPAFRVEGPLDIVGAGDATTAGTMLGLTLGLRLSEATLLGSCISSITIQQIGTTGTASLDQVRKRLETLL